jgi:hypothetical protein
VSLPLSRWRRPVAGITISSLVFILTLTVVFHFANSGGMYIRVNSLVWSLFGPPERIYSWTNLALPQYIVGMIAVPIALWLAQLSWRIVTVGPRYSTWEMIIAITLVALIIGSVSPPFHDLRAKWPIATFCIASLLASWLVLKDTRQTWWRSKRKASVSQHLKPASKVHFKTDISE